MPEYLIDDENFDSPEWCEYKPGIKVAIRPLSNKKMDDIKEKYTKKTRSWKRHQQTEEVDIDQRKIEEDTRDWIVADWEGFVRKDSQGNKVPVKCTSEIKLKLLDYDHDLRCWAIDRATNFAVLKSEAREKNSIPTSTGTNEV